MAPNHNTHLIVKNVRNTSDKKPTCGCHSWREHWLRATRSQRTTCAVFGCTSEIAVGAHVRMTDGRRSNQIYIVGICAQCNHYTNREEMAINQNAKIISPQPLDTCQG